MGYGADNRRAIIEYFRSGERSGLPASGKLGVEVEHTVVFEDGTQVAYEPREGRLGIREVLEYLSADYPERSYSATGELIGLASSDGSITLEPAAQVEISIAPFSLVADVEAAYKRFRDRIDPFLASHGARIVTGGYHPTQHAHDLVLIPKRRYAFMDAYFAEIGTHGERMMRASTSTQVSVDYSDEADAVRKLRVSSALAPVFAAIADSTTSFEGEPNHTPLARLRLWRDVDNARCGVVPGVFEEGFGYAAYADWLLGTSPIFVTRASADDPDGDALRPFSRTPAGEVYADAPVSKGDVEHIISMFWPDVRLKRFVEIRPADCMPAQEVMGYAALIKGLYYSEESLAEIERQVGVRPGADRLAPAWPLSQSDVEDAIASIEHHGLDGDVYGTPLRNWIDLVFELAEAALPEEERAYLTPLKAYAADKSWWDVSPSTP